MNRTVDDYSQYIKSSATSTDLVNYWAHCYFDAFGCHVTGEPSRGTPSGYVTGSNISRLVFWPVHRLSAYKQSTNTADNRIFVGTTAIVGINNQFYKTSSFKKDYTPLMSSSPNVYWTAHFDGSITPPSWKTSMYFKGGWKLDSTTNLNNSSQGVARPKMAVWNQSPVYGVGSYPPKFADHFTISSFPYLTTLTSNAGVTFGGGGYNAGHSTKYLGTDPIDNSRGLFAVKGAISLGVLKDQMGGKNLSGLTTPSIGLTCMNSWKITGKINYTANNGSKGTYNYTNYNLTKSNSGDGNKWTIAYRLMQSVTNSYTPAIHVHDMITKFYTRTGIGA